MPGRGTLENVATEMSKGLSFIEKAELQQTTRDMAASTLCDIALKSITPDTYEINFYSESYGQR